MSSFLNKLKCLFGYHQYVVKRIYDLQFKQWNCLTYWICCRCSTINGGIVDGLKNPDSPWPDKFPWMIISTERVKEILNKNRLN
jgi:hypothetical protein